MIKFVGVTKARGRRTALEFICETCGELWEAARFPISLETLENVVEYSSCPSCGSDTISVTEESIKDPNDD